MRDTRSAWWLGYALVVVGFLATVFTYYDRTTGLTVFLSLAADSHGYELPAVRNYPHPHIERGYDGQFYAQMATDPLLRDPDIDRAMDKPGYRAHRILLSWTAWLLAGGDPARAFAVFPWLNVGAWLILAAVLLVWCPPRDARTFALWAGVLLSHGVLTSVRNSLTDAPSVLLTALAVLAVDRGRPWLSAIVIGVSGLARETNVAAGVALLQRLRRDRRSWVIVAGGLVVCVLPLALWLDYLRSIYRSAAFAGGDHISMPFAGIAWKVNRLIGEVQHSGTSMQWFMSVTGLLGVVSQVVTLVWLTWVWRRDRAGSRGWLLVAWPFLLLGVTAHQVIWDGTPGAITRVILPLSVGVNMLLAARPSVSWWAVIAVNLGVIAGMAGFVLRWI